MTMMTLTTMAEGRRSKRQGGSSSTAAPRRLQEGEEARPRQQRDRRTPAHLLFLLHRYTSPLSPIYTTTTLTLLFTPSHTHTRTRAFALQHGVKIKREREPRIYIERPLFFLRRPGARSISFSCPGLCLRVSRPLLGQK